MQRIGLILFLAILILPGCRSQQEAPPEPSTSARSAESASGAEGLAYRIEATGRVREALEACVAEDLEGLEKTATASGWELRIVARDSADQNIYCDSLITLSGVYLQRSEAGTELYRVAGHRVSTIPSENVDPACEKIVEGFVETMQQGG